jgi:hypothetical protein
MQAQENSQGIAFKNLPNNDISTALIIYQTAFGNKKTYWDKHPVFSYRPFVSSFIPRKLLTIYFGRSSDLLLL